MARFDKRARLRKPSEFKAVRDRGERLDGRLLDAIVSAGSGEGARLGLAIAGRNVSHATRRNRLKRMVRESFRQNAEHLPDVDVVITARRGAASPGTDAAVREELMQLWARIAAQCRKS